MITEPGPSGTYPSVVVVLPGYAAEVPVVVPGWDAEVPVVLPGYAAVVEPGPVTSPPGDVVEPGYTPDELLSSAGEVV